MIELLQVTSGQLCDCGSGKVATDCCYKPKK
jgi:hypothetical protein